ncbi:MAG: hypothetical protein GY715_17070 [Planctomycetes bacterium]|nr:hypothetical protein [Planctomycetota bacterium]
MLGKVLVAGTFVTTLALTANLSAGTPTGVCCFIDGACVITDAGSCTSGGGDYLGDGTNCGDEDCYYTPATAINYQGQLAQAGVPVDDICEATFTLWDAEAGGTQLGSAVTVTDLNVVDGVFSTALDFGMAAFAGRERWLEISVGCPAGSSLTTLSPRQPLLAAPYAIMAAGSNQLFQVFDPSGFPRVQLEAGVDYETGAFDGGLLVTHSSGAQVELGGDGIWIQDPAEEDIFGLWNEGSQVGMFMRHPNGSEGLSAQPGTVIVRAPSGPGFAGLFIQPDGRGRVQADDIFISGDLHVGGLKNFRIPNPNDPSTDLVYTCPEGPEAAVYVRGTAKLESGRAVISFPDHFASIIDATSITVHLTPHSVDSIGLAAIERSEQGFVAADREGGTYEFDYRVMAVRKGYENYKVVRPARGRNVSTVEVPE